MHYSTVYTTNEKKLNTTTDGDFDTSLYTAIDIVKRNIAATACVYNVSKVLGDYSYAAILRVSKSGEDINGSNMWTQTYEFNGKKKSNIFYDLEHCLYISGDLIYRKLTRVATVSNGHLSFVIENPVRGEDVNALIRDRAEPEEDPDRFM
jgi:hypothetical protein